MGDCEAGVTQEEEGRLRQMCGHAARGGLHSDAQSRGEQDEGAHRLISNVVPAPEHPHRAILPVSLTMGDGGGALHQGPDDGLHPLC